MSICYSSRLRMVIAYAGIASCAAMARGQFTYSVRQSAASLDLSAMSASQPAGLFFANAAEFTFAPFIFSRSSQVASGTASAFGVCSAYSLATADRIRIVQGVRGRVGSAAPGDLAGATSTGSYTFDFTVSGYNTLVAGQGYGPQSFASLVNLGTSETVWAISGNEGFSTRGVLPGNYRLQAQAGLDFDAAGCCQDAGGVGGINVDLQIEPGQPCSIVQVAITDFSNVVVNTVGDATSSEMLRLSPNFLGSVGAAWLFENISDLRYGFNVEFTFRIVGQGDGFAFVIQDESPGAIGGSGGGLGYMSNNAVPGIRTALAVEFDTLSPGLPAEPPADHVAVRYSGFGPAERGEQHNLAIAPIPDINDGAVHLVNVDYSFRMLRVSVDGVLLITLPLNLETLRTFQVPVGDSVLSALGCAWLGFTASNPSSSFAAEHDILSMNVGPGVGPCPDGLVISTFDLEPNPVRAGQPLEYRVTFSGGEPITYQWRRNDVNLVNSSRIQGVHTDTLTINPVLEEDEGIITIRADNLCGGLIVGPTLVVLCPSDWDGDQDSDSDDIIVFFSQWENGEGDIDGDDDSDSDDVIGFFAFWENGC